MGPWIQVYPSGLAPDVPEQQVVPGNCASWSTSQVACFLPALAEAAGKVLDFACTAPASGYETLVDQHVRWKLATVRVHATAGFQLAQGESMLQQTAPEANNAGRVMAVLGCVEESLALIGQACKQDDLLGRAHRLVRSVAVAASAQLGQASSWSMWESVASLLIARDAWAGRSRGNCTGKWVVASSYWRCRWYWALSKPTR